MDVGSREGVQHGKRPGIKRLRVEHDNVGVKAVKKVMRNAQGLATPPVKPQNPGLLASTIVVVVSRSYG
jgi:hypothetical protein